MDEFDAQAGTVAPLRAALEQMGEQWRRLGAPIAEALRPGIPPSDVEVLAAQHGLVVPLELKVLWAWHDGSEPGGSPWLSRRIGPGGFEFLSAEDSFQAYADNRQIHPEPAPDLPELYWHQSWLPFMKHDAYRLYVDCDRVTWNIGGSPIRLVRWDWEGFDIDCAQSLTQAVQLWAWVLEQGYVTYGPDGWSTHADLPPWLVRTGLV